MRSGIKREKTESNCYIARLTTEDAPLLIDLEDRVHLSYWGVENYRRFLEEFPEFFGCKAVICREGGRQELVGFVLARAVDENLEILKLGVAPEYQRCGVGAALMETACAEGIRRGCSKCFLEVRKSNHKAIQFYHNQGFRVIGTRPHYYSDPVEDAWVMARNL